MNLYAYVGNDPLNLTDPSGLLARETATKAYGVYNSLASGLISQPSLLPPLGTPDPVVTLNRARSLVIATASGAVGGAVTGALQGKITKK